MWPKKLQALGKAITMEQRYHITQCHLSTTMRFWLVGIPAKIYLKRFSRCGGKENVMLTVSITHPRRTW